MRSQSQHNTDTSPQRTATPVLKVEVDRLANDIRQWVCDNVETEEVCRRGRSYSERRGEFEQELFYDKTEVFVTGVLYQDVRYTSGDYYTAPEYSVERQRVEIKEISFFDPYGDELTTNLNIRELNNKVQR